MLPPERLILHNCRLLTMDAELTDFSGGWIEIEDDTITRLGMGTPPDGPQMDMDGDLVMPGMVNPHCHMPMTLFRGLGEDVDDRLFRYILPLERALMTAELVTVGATVAALEMIRGGVTTVADMYYFEDHIGGVLHRAGMRGVLGQTLANFDAPDHKSMDEGFALLDKLADLCDGHPLLTASAAPHAPYSTGVEVMERIADWSDAHPDLPIQMHLAETKAELDWAAEQGATTVELTDRAGLLTDRLIAAHVMYPTEDDMDLIAESGTHVAHNPRSNGKAGRGVAPITALRKRGVQVGIATDGPMSGNTLDLFSQFAPAVMFQNIAQGTRSALPAVEVVRMATIEGAATLRMDHKIGSLEPGKQADLIRISLKDPRLHPIYDIYSMLVYATMPTDVVSTMVAGKWLMRHRQVQTIDTEKAMADFLQTARMFKINMAKLDIGT
jgi:cytosine/adenosine deaminase-related metal-dependent hydrolase